MKERRKKEENVNIYKTKVLLTLVKHARKRLEEKGEF